MNSIPIVFLVRAMWHWISAFALRIPEIASILGCVPSPFGGYFLSTGMQNNASLHQTMSLDFAT
jgi:hypothetical protein